MIRIFKHILIFGLSISCFELVAKNNLITEREYEYIKGHLLVKTTHENQSLKQVEKLVGAKVVKNFSLVKGLKLYQFDTTKDAEEVKAEFEKNNAVEYAELDYIYKISSTNDPKFIDQWALENSGQSAGILDADINAEKMWQIEQGSKEIVLGIIDTGFDYTHPDLVDNIWTNPLEIPNNQKDDDNNGYKDDVYGINAILNNGNPMDDNIHGTHVAGIIGARGNNGVGVSGVAQKISMVACKFLSASGSGGTSDAIECLEYFGKLKTHPTNPVNIVATNNSWGGGPSSKSMKDAIKAHDDLGILFIAAAGNEGQNNDIKPSYPASYDVNNIITVASTDRKDILSSFSNYGKKTVHVAAPGSKILSTVLNHGYGELSGTSMASPQVAGLVGVIASKYPSYNYTQIKNLVMSSGQIIDSTKNTTISGRRIRGADDNGVGALSCLNQTLKVKKAPLASSYTIPINEPFLLSALYINCEKFGGDLSVYNKNGTNIVLQDLGTNGDEKAADGISSLLWIPTTPGSYELDFGVEKVNIVVYESTLAKAYKAYDIEYAYEFVHGQRLQAKDETMHHVISDFKIPFGDGDAGFDKLFISSNGTISLTDSTATDHDNLDLPQSDYNTLIVPFWDDLDFIVTGADIYVQTLGSAPNRKLVVEWWKVKHFNASGIGAFQVIFYEDSPDIRFNYLDTNFGNSSYNYGKSATIGIQTSNNVSTNYSYKTASAQSLSSVIFKLE